ncbi:hypothetical protein [Streptomyces sp. NPDC051286]|uniref:hypothetical protein n=1 Tax=Streptomyces sp. NPDC051286 TaxID=3365647 RepID=UPI00378DD3FB
MINAERGKWFARFTRDGEEGEFEYLPVIAWGLYDEGEEYRAFVLDADAGTLVPACGVKGFAGIADAQEVELAEMTPEEMRERNKRMRERR